AAMAAVWLVSLLPLLGGGDQRDVSFISTTAQVWSRSGEASDAAAPFRLWGDLWTATMFLAASVAGVLTARANFANGRSMMAAGFVGGAIISAAAAAWFISSQWAGATLFDAGTVNAGWLYTVTRAWLIQFYAGLALLVVFAGLV